MTFLVLFRSTCIQLYAIKSVFLTHRETAVLSLTSQRIYAQNIDRGDGGSRTIGLCYRPLELVTARHCKTDSRRAVICCVRRETNIINIKTVWHNRTTIFIQVDTPLSRCPLSIFKEVVAVELNLVITSIQMLVSRSFYRGVIYMNGI